MKPQTRKTLQHEIVNQDAPQNAPINYNATRPTRPMSSFDPSMALTLLFLLTVLLFLGFFSIYIPCFSRQSSVEFSRRRRHSQQRASSKARALPLFVYDATKLDHRPMECAICLCEFEEKETVRMIPYCGHLFHQQCLDAWFYSKVSCPLCRSTQLFRLNSAKRGSSSSSASSSSLAVDDPGVGGSGGGSTVGEVERQVLLSGLRRTSSCNSSFSEREVLLSLQRSWSF